MNLLITRFNSIGEEVQVDPAESDIVGHLHEENDLFPETELLMDHQSLEKCLSSNSLTSYDHLIHLFNTSQTECVCVS